MAINTTLESASTTAASNGPAGSDQRTLADDGLRQYLAFIKALKTLAVLASATTVTPPSTANAFSVTGTTAITTIASTNSWDGRDILFIFAGILTLTNGSNLILPGSANITTAAGDAALLVQVASGQWRVVGYSRADGSLVVGTQTLTALTLTGNLSVQGNTTIGNASGDTLTIHPNAITWQNDPTHSANHTFTGNVTVNGNTVLGNAGTDTITTTGNVVVNLPTAGVGLAVAGAGSGVLAATFGSSASDQRTKFTSSNALAVQVSSNAGTNVGAYIGALDTTTTPGLQFSNTNGTGLLVIAHDGRIYASNIHNNGGAVTGTTNQYIASADNWTPTFTAVSNCTATGTRGQWIRVGNVVTCSGIGTVDPTVATTPTTFRISLPIASSLTAAGQLAGTAVQQSPGGGDSFAGGVVGDAASDEAIVLFQCGTDVASRIWSFTFTYTIV